MNDFDEILEKYEEIRKRSTGKRTMYWGYILLVENPTEFSNNLKKKFRKTIRSCMKTSKYLLIEEWYQIFVKVIKIQDLLDVNRIITQYVAFSENN